MSNFRARLMTERVQLMHKIQKLNAFILSDAYDNLPEIDRLDLKEQNKHMKMYLAVLDRRVSRLCTDA